ncbi:MAG TPA: DUF1217 domain-containing protein [Roseiarcus sp.]|nr:DUF1217 domain-containing protein [Roseiarcus sp.]
MTSTTTAYLAVSQNLSRYQAMTAAEPAVKTATAYYDANIGSVTSIQDLVGNYRLLSYALDAYGLGDEINAKGLITKVLEGGVSNPKSLANTLGDPRWKAFAAAFNFSGGASPSSASSVQTTTSGYDEQQLESDQGAQDVGVQLALYFQRVAPTVTSEYGILADPNLLEVAATIMGISPSAAGDLQPQTLSELMPLSDLQDPAKLQQLTERFTAMYDYTYGPGSGATSGLTVDSGNLSSEPSGASAVLASIISSNGSVLGSALSDFTGASQPTFSTALMSSMSRLTLGG